MAKRSVKTRRRIVKSKKALPKIIIGAGVLAGGYLLWDRIIKPYMNSGADKNTDLGNTTDQAIQQVVNTAQNTTPNANTFSPIGTAWANLKFDTLINYGSRGEEVKAMQQILNAVHDRFTQNNMVPKYNKVKIDGIFGGDTWKEHKKISFNAKTLRNWVSWRDQQYNYAKGDNTDYTDSWWYGSTTEQNINPGAGLITGGGTGGFF
jgi:hypothetical protein